MRSIDKNDMLIKIDTQEKKISHITNFFQKNNINYTFEKLQFADYALEYKNILHTDLLIERKTNLEELSNNFCNRSKIKNRDRFKKEFEKAKENNSKLLLMIEDDSLTSLITGRYNTNFKAISYVASILSWRNRYNFNLDFITKATAGYWIYINLYYSLYNTLDKK